MPRTYDEMISEEMAESYLYQRARLTKALQTAESRELDVLYHLVAREMVKTDPPLLISHVEITVSAQCTLHCQDCANLMPKYRKPEPMNLEDCIRWTKGFLEAVDHVLLFSVMGGEPFMQKELPRYLEFLLAQDKVQRIQLVTNGTLTLPKACIPLLQQKKCFLRVSNYGKISSRYEAVIREAVSLGIAVGSTRGIMAWQDMGGFNPRARDRATLLAVYRGCPMNCRHIWNGELHACPRSAHGKALGLIPVPGTDYVRLEGNSVESRRASIRALYDVPFMTACDYCNALEERRQIPCARQIKKDGRPSDDC